jgi:hypothetical protein
MKKSKNYIFETLDSIILALVTPRKESENKSLEEILEKNFVRDVL